MATDSIIKIKNVTFTYSDTKEPAIDHLSLEIKRGTWTAIIGHNGSGKSTIIRLINGLLIPDNTAESSIEVDGSILDDSSVWEIRNKVGIVFQNPDNQFVGATVADDVAFGLENRGIPREKMLKIVPEAINAVGMADYINSEPASLSGGQKQRVAIAGIIAIKPKIIILDEATSMLDPEGRSKILQIVQQMKKEYDLTVISITHDIDEASLADQVIVLNDGKLVEQGSSSQIFSQVKLLKDLGLDVPFFEQIKDKLMHAGVNMPQSISSEKELIKFLCQLNLNK